MSAGPDIERSLSDEDICQADGAAGFIRSDLPQRTELLLRLGERQFTDALETAKAQGLAKTSLNSKDAAAALAYLSAHTPAETASVERRAEADERPHVRARGTHLSGKLFAVDTGLRCYLRKLSSRLNEEGRITPIKGDGEKDTTRLSEIMWSLACEQRTQWPLEDGANWPGVCRDGLEQKRAEEQHPEANRAFGCLCQRLLNALEESLQNWNPRNFRVLGSDAHDVASQSLMKMYSTYWSQRATTRWLGMSCLLNTAVKVASRICIPSNLPELTDDVPGRAPDSSEQEDLPMPQRARQALRKLLEAGFEEIPPRGLLRRAFSLTEPPQCFGALRGKSSVYACAYHLLGFPNNQIARQCRVAPAAVSQSLHNSWRDPIGIWAQQELEKYDDGDTP
jgi:hypothetical protein